ncbi:hypothetical protein BLS_007313 [Venturia inaequalis]|uniref:Exportin-5 C-terminal domain-containing protein n=1 Tax=Venturia inaequalis TaxID=5025 RepID=A0A8H3V6W7_VENIN|nr:hypothetical protein BLS_007313 [Venturia inaequalis]
MEMCSSRLVRYESLPEDSEEPTVLFLEHDFDTIPEKHAFLGNYRRYCVEVVEAVVRKFPVDAVNHILGQAQTLLREIQQELASFQPQQFSKKSTPFLRVDAQILLVDAAVKGYNKYLEHQDETDPQQNEVTRNTMLSTFVEFYENSLAMDFIDPAVQRRVLSSLVGMVVRVFKQPRPDLAVVILQRLLQTNMQEDPSLPDYSEAVRSLSYLGVTESQKLATYLPNTLYELYDDLEKTVQNMHATRNYDEAHRLGFNAFLFIITLKARDLDEATRLTRLRAMLQESTDVWTNQEFTESAQGFESFLTILGLGPLPQYLFSHNFHKLQEWGENFLDAEGIAIQANVNDRMEHVPHRATRTLLMATFDKLSETDPIHDTAVSLWSEAMPTILPTLLKTLRHVHAFGDRSSWGQLPEEMQHVMHRILTDRFWQAGISTESMEDFYARVNSSKNSYEGFASTIRGALRQVREKSYSILCYLARLNGKFYGLPDLPGAIADAVYGTIQSLSAHQTTVLVNMSSQLIGRCPADLRGSFLPPVLVALFQQLDLKLNSEWEAVVHRTSQTGEDDNLNDEMKSESILRLLTFNAVSVANSLLDIDPSISQNDPSNDSRMHKMILERTQVFGQMLIFLTSALRFRDTRSCNMVIQIFGRTLPFFSKPSDFQVYICDNVLKAAIQSFNEPYFVDAQKNLASLIAQIISMDATEKGVPRSILLSLPGLGENKVDKVIAKVRSSKSAQQGGNAVLSLLSGLRGVSIHELGKMPTAEVKKKKKVIDVGMEVVVDGIRRGGEEGLDGVSAMFGRDEMR